MRVKRVRVVFVGPAGVGKTSLVRVINGQNIITDTDSTVGLCAITMNSDDGIPIELWDTAGQERYAPMMDLYTRDADIIVAAHDHFIDYDQMRSILKRLETSCNPKRITTFALWQTKRDLCASANPQIASPFVVHHRAYVSALEDPDEVRELFNELIRLHVRRCPPTTTTKPTDPEKISLFNSLNSDETILGRRFGCGYC